MKRVWLGPSIFRLNFFRWIIAFGFVYALCAPIGDAYGASSISGRVVDSATSAGIEGVTIVAMTAVPGQMGFGQTNATGNFSFSVPADGTYTMTLVKDGYVTLVGLTAVIVVVSGNTPIANPITMTPTGAGHSVSGTVINATTFAALSGVTVTATDPSGNVAGSQVTDGSGNFSISLPADGLYDLTFVKAGYASITGSQALPVMVIGNYTYPGPIPMTPSTKLDLAQGWNFISLPKLPNSTAITDVLSDVSADLAVVWGYDNEAKQWLKYRSSAMNNTLLTVRPGLGYWVYLQKAGSLDTSWWLPLGTHSMHVYKGWNLLGYNGKDSLGWATALQSISGKWSILWTWDSKWYVKSPTLNLAFDPITGLSLGKAYWVKGSGEAKWLQSTDTSGNVWVIDSIPADNTSGLSSNAVLQVQMWNDVDPSSVTNSSVALYGNSEFGMFRSGGLAAYDAVKNAITFQPQGSGMTNRAEYTLVLKGGAIKDTSGNFMFDDYKVTVSTVRNELKKYVDYRPDGTVREYGIYEFDANGDLARHVHYDGAGPDLTWFTADDDVSYYEKYAMPAFYGGFGMKTTYDGPGSDGIWFTPDDQGFGPDPGYTITGALGIQMMSSNPAFASTYIHDALKSFRITQSAMGPFQTDYSYNQAGYLTRIDYGDPVGEGADRYSWYDSKEYNGDNFPVREVTYGGPGVDGEWFTADDEVMSYSVNTYDANGGLIQTVKYVSPGSNGLWLDGDDTASFCTKFTYGANNLLARSEYYGDISSAGTPCTGTLYEYTQYGHDAQGRKTAAIRYGGPGPDGNWFTNDDVPLTAYEYDTTW